MEALFIKELLIACEVNARCSQIASCTIFNLILARDENCRIKPGLIHYAGSVEFNVTFVRLARYSSVGSVVISIELNHTRIHA